ncbi:MAG: hypothetical protein K2N38_07025 [Oscillospiraceae bacterium]|nr:hypothetical protein [Oscillospiraceae bacterium]
MSENDRIINELKGTMKQLQRQHKTRRRGRRGPVEVYFEGIPAADKREEVQTGIEQLADISREFLKMKKVYRWHLKKISELSDTSVIHVCHRYVEENRLKDEWKEFREEREKL